jgi:phosphotransacetylase
MAKNQIPTYTPNTAELQQELQETGRALREAYEKFNYVSDDELVEACSYEISALKARYSYLLRRIKELSAEEEAYIAASNMKGGKACPS